jgi:hypothetical protein
VPYSPLPIEVGENALHSSFLLKICAILFFVVAMPVGAQEAAPPAPPPAPVVTPDISAEPEMPLMNWCSAPSPITRNYPSRVKRRKPRGSD